MQIMSLKKIGLSYFLLSVEKTMCLSKVKKGNAKNQTDIHKYTLKYHTLAFSKFSTDNAKLIKERHTLVSMYGIIFFGNVYFKINIKFSQ